MTDDINHRIAAATRDEYVKQVARARVALDRELNAEAAGKLADVAAAKQRLAFCEAEARKWAKFANSLNPRRMIADELTKQDFEDA